MGNGDSNQPGDRTSAPRRGRQQAALGCRRNHLRHLPGRATRARQALRAGATIRAPTPRRSPMPSSSSGSRLGRLLQQECLAAIESLAATGSDVHAHVHEARKAIRRARSLAALVGSRFEVETADGILHRAGDSLGALRDARVVALTAARLGQRSGVASVLGLQKRMTDLGHHVDHVARQFDIHRSFKTHASVEYSVDLTKCRDRI